mmetsp:Transcript_17376/g.32952  ORF Transcript_17376/g.32952 Transcript_17376/m.32952 type:complete len:243 (+) Transcript_17376:2025-2753(+)
MNGPPVTIADGRSTRLLFEITELLIEESPSLGTGDNRPDSVAFPSITSLDAISSRGQHPPLPSVSSVSSSFSCDFDDRALHDFPLYTWSCSSSPLLPPSSPLPSSTSSSCSPCPKITWLLSTLPNSKSIPFISNTTSGYNTMSAFLAASFCALFFDPPLPLPSSTPFTWTDIINSDDNVQVAVFDVADKESCPLCDGDGNSIDTNFGCDQCLLLHKSCKALTPVLPMRSSVVINHRFVFLPE